ncbi:BamA/TamA family outer membrane protein [Pontibacter sp. G13]|uniref:BamA/TamA family outer membrane protein n=1 Tax=Pontibacter sp. G13 TaxID=3074898 RepID=UPI00288A6F23|nr:BamA/TamA family outer membrane protein [Pontibacter sp. G13]WNJ16740.1 BamA/TamA family outer membrane protein [Pontibacter sp. G13]
MGVENTCRYLCTVFLLMMAGTLEMYAQVDSTQMTPKQEERFQRKEARRAKRQAKIDEGKWLITPLAGPGYTPELGLILSLDVLFTFRTQPSNPLLKRSSIPITLGFSTTGAILANIRPVTFWASNRLRINGKFWFKDLPDHYWGIGYQQGISVPEEDSLTGFTRRWMWLNPEVVWEIRNNDFIGLNVDVNYTQGRNPSARVEQDPNYLTYNSRPLNTGLGVILRHDSRDMPVNAWNGWFLDASATFYIPFLGGDNRYQAYALDYRQYLTLGRPGQVLAWQAKTRFAFGEVPYGEMSMVGSPFDLRGYRWGHFRDMDMVFALAEFRYTFLRKGGKELSPHGAVGWVGLGSVFDIKKTSLDELGLLPNAGIGYRLAVQPRMNIRLDFGVGRDSFGFYFNFHEAF